MYSSCTPNFPWSFAAQPAVSCNTRHPQDLQFKLGLHLLLSRGARGSGFGVNKAPWWAQGWLRDQLLFLIHRNCSYEPSQMCPLPWLCDAHIHTCALTQAVQRACFPKTPHSSFISAPISPPPPFQEVSNYCFPAHKHLRLAQQGHMVGGSGKEKSCVCVCV